MALCWWFLLRLGGRCSVSVACCSVVSVWMVFVVVFGSPMELALLNWNVRGLNNPAKRRAVQSFVADL